MLTSTAVRFGVYVVALTDLCGCASVPEKTSHCAPIQAADSPVRSWHPPPASSVARLGDEVSRCEQAVVGSIAPASFSEAMLVPVESTAPAAGESFSGADEAGEQRTLTLDELFRLTFQANPDLRAALMRMQVAEETLARARADSFPVLAINERYQASNNPLQKFSYRLSQDRVDPLNPFAFDSVEDNLQTQLGLRQQIYSGGQRTAQMRSAKAEREAADFLVGAVQNQILYRVAEAYYRLLQARELVEVRQESVRQVKGHLRDVQTRLEAGSAVRSDVLQMEVRQAQVLEQLITAENQLELGWAILENVTGVSLAGRQLPEQVPRAPWSDHVAQVELTLTEALQRRQEIGQGDRQLEAAQQRVRAAQAGKYPTLSCEADYGLFTGDLRTGTDSFFIGAVLSFTLFDGDRTKSNVRQAEALMLEQLARNDRVRLDIELDVRRAYLQLKDARERHEVSSTSLASARENLRQATARYEAESASISQLIDAQVAHSDVRVHQTSTEIEVEIARAQLERAVGRLPSLVGIPCQLALPCVETPR